MIRTRVLLGGGAVALVLPAAAWAQTESRVSADATVTGGYSNNPFSTAGAGDTGAAVVTLDLSPRWVIATPRSTVVLSGDANLQQYLRQYGRNDSYSVAADYRGRPSERLTTHARIELSSAVLGSFNNYLPLAGTGAVAGTTDATGAVGATGTVGASAGTATAPGLATAPITTTTITPLTQFTDVGFFGLRSRRRSGRAAGDVALAVSARDSLTASEFYELSRYSELRAGDYEAVGGALGYSRQLSGRVSLGLSGSGSRYTYRNASADSTVYSIQATGSAQLSERWFADGALGVSFVDSGSAASTRSTSLSGNLNLCRRDPRSSTCVQLVRQVTPTGVAGTQYVTSAGLSWSRQLDPRQSVTLGANYSKVGGGNQLVAGLLPLETQYLQTSASYNRRVGPRLGVVVSAYYRDLLDDTVRRPTDFGGQVGLTYRLGDRR